jgi:hypothetical protein
MDTKKFLFTLGLIAGTMALTLSAVAWFMLENFALIHVLMLMSGTACFTWCISEYNYMYSNERVLEDIHHVMREASDLNARWIQLDREREELVRDQVADFLERDSRA